MSDHNIVLLFLYSLKTDSVACHKWIIGSELDFFIGFDFVVAFIPQAAIDITTCSSFSVCDWDYSSIQYGGIAIESELDLGVLGSFTSRDTFWTWSGNNTAKIWVHRFSTKPKTIAAGNLGSICKPPKGFQDNALMEAWVRNPQAIFFHIKHTKTVIVRVNIG